MAAIYIGSARHDELNKYSGGKNGDQLQVSNDMDCAGEVSMQLFYNHSKGWYVLRPKDEKIAEKIAQAMADICNNPNIGYNQANRLGIIKNGIDACVPTACDCSSAVRACVVEASGIDPGNFTTATEVQFLQRTGLFEERFSFVTQTSTPVYNGDILVTKQKGHTVVVVSGSPRVLTKYYPRYTGTSTAIIDALREVGEVDVSLTNRKRIGVANGIAGVGTDAGNRRMLNLLKAGTLKRV